MATKNNAEKKSRRRKYYGVDLVERKVVIEMDPKGFWSLSFFFSSFFLLSSREHSLIPIDSMVFNVGCDKKTLQCEKTTIEKALKTLVSISMEMVFQSSK